APGPPGPLGDLAQGQGHRKPGLCGRGQLHRAPGRPPLRGRLAHPVPQGRGHRLRRRYGAVGTRPGRPRSVQAMAQAIPRPPGPAALGILWPLTADFLCAPPRIWLNFVFMKIASEVVISATPDRIWNTLVDFAAY